VRGGGEWGGGRERGLTACTKPRFCVGAFCGRCLIRSVVLRLPWRCPLLFLAHPLHLSTNSNSSPVRRSVRLVVVDGCRRRVPSVCSLFPSGLWSRLSVCQSVRPRPGVASPVFIVVVVVVIVAVVRSFVVAGWVTGRGP
jgi:hypothetical protein